MLPAREKFPQKAFKELPVRGKFPHKAFKEMPVREKISISTMGKLHIHVVGFWLDFHEFALPVVKQAGKMFWTAATCKFLRLVTYSVMCCHSVVNLASKKW